ncbi:MAG: MBL fold metallo-hydrolase [Candidatus Peregrinibacteria bacterium]
MKLTSYGAAEEVTGSQHLLEVNGKKILLDCGLFQGKRQESFGKNANFGYDPAKIDVLLLSHAHIDHSGNIPRLITHGFKGKVYCTAATKQLCAVMLADSAHVQESDAEYFGRKHADTALQPIEALYTIQEAQTAMESFKIVPFNKTFEICDGVKATYREAGHVFGSAIIVMDIMDKKDGNKEKHFMFSGDLGRCKLPIINDPYQVTETEYLLMESTYGNRTHTPIEEGLPELARVINRTIRRGGKVIIPAFAFERTQELIYGLNLLGNDKKIPANLPIFIDSPLASNITDIFQRNIELYDKEIKAQFKMNKNPFQTRQLKHVSSVEESKKLNFFIGPCVIISASGMCEAGRIRHHLKNNIEDPKNTVVIVGYMAEHTLGRKLVDGDPMIKIFDTMYKVRAEIVVLESFSAHADMNDLDDYIKKIKGLKKIMLVHGEPNQSGPMAERVHKALGVEVDIMKPGETVEF